MISQKQILIVSSSRDQTIPKVQTVLERRGYQVIYFKTDLVAKGYIQFALSLEDKPVFVYQGAPVDIRTIAAAWQRKPVQEFHFDDRASEQTMVKEVRSLQDGMWHLISEDRWFNHPQHVRNGEYKIHQLLLARQVGLSIPQTVLSNRWSPIKDKIGSNEVVLKMARGIYNEAYTSKSLYTTVLTKDTLPIKTNPFPGIWQNYVTKKREWRVTFVGDKVFSAAIYTDDKARDDWRKLGMTDHVTFKAELFPKAIEQKCRLLLRKLNLSYAAFDFIEDEDGNITFLELNPAGQYLWLEAELGLPISEAIADELIAIAQTYQGDIHG